MTTETNLPILAELKYIPYIDSDGKLPEEYQGKIGVYAIFDANQILQFIGYSRDVFLSLRQHLVRQPQACCWIKVETIKQPSRSILEAIEKAWVIENGTTPPGNGSDKNKWIEPIDSKTLMTPEELANYENKKHDEITKIKILKNVARRVEAEIIAILQQRGLGEQIRFNPKLKEEGLLDLKS
jgi:hypothetical protein